MKSTFRTLGRVSRLHAVTMTLFLFFFFSISRTSTYSSKPRGNGPPDGPQELRVHRAFFWGTFVFFCLVFYVFNCFLVLT